MNPYSLLNNILALIIGSMLFCMPVKADAMKTGLASQIDEVFSQFNQPDSPGCAVSVIKNGEIIFARGYGQASLEYNSPITSKTIFYIASTSKQFTALSVLLASRQGFFSLDDEISQYFPELPKYDKPITIRHLIHHTSGLRDYIGLYGLAGASEDGYVPESSVLELIGRQQGLNFTPGTAWSYSNSGYFLLGQLIKRATGMTLREFATKNIFTPLGIKHTFFFDNHREIVPNRAQGHVKIRENKFEKVQTSFDLVGSGGLVTTTDDLFLYDQNFYKNILEHSDQALLADFLKPGLLDNGEPALVDNSDVAYGYGLAVDQYKGYKQVHHSGGFIGFSAEYIRFPEQKFSVIILCNIANIGVTELAHKVTDLFLPDLTHTPVESSIVSTVTPAAAVSADSLRRWVGHYWSEEYPFGLSKVVFHEDKLWLASPAGFGPDIELEALSDHQFRSTTGPTAGSMYTFSVDNDGTITMVMDIALFGKWKLQQIADFIPTPKDYQAIAGIYYSPELDARSQIYVEGENLHIRTGYGAAFQAIPVTSDTYVLNGNVIHFERGANQSVSGFTINSTRIKGIKFIRQ